MLLTARLVSRAVSAGVFAYVAKPFGPNDLLPAIETAAARQEELLAACRELGRSPVDEPAFEVVVTGAAGTRWPLRITREAGGGIDVTC